MLTGRTYVVTDPALCAAVQKASNVLSFDPIVAEVTPRLLGLNAQTANIINGRPGQKMDDDHIVKRSHHIINTPLLPQNIHGISGIQIDYFDKAIASLGDGSQIDVWRWIRDTVTLGSFKTFYGPNNPFEKHPDLVDDLWDWEAGNITYMAGFFPSIFARKAVRGLEACVRGFEKYIKADGYRDAYKILQGRNQLHVDMGLTDVHERARLEIGIAFAFNVNVTSTVFWMINHVFSRHETLSKIREEIRNNAIVDGVLSTECLRQSCPRLNSAMRETLRLYMPAVSARFAVEDTILADTWLVRKGSVVQLAGSAIHHDPEVWGPDCDTFNPDRFRYSLSGSKTNPDGTVPEDKAHFVHPAAFRSFGGGTSLCPGRHFAHGEIVGLAGVLLMAFDMIPVGGTAWCPPANVKRLPISAMKPLKELKVELARRKEFEGIKWELKL